MTEYGVSAYSEDSILSYKNLLKELNLNTISLLMTCHTLNKESHNIDCDSNDSPSKKNIFKILKQGKQEGYKTSLRVYVDLLSGDWRAYWDPKDKTKAFEELQKQLVSIAQESERIDLDLLILGAEYEKLTQPQFRSQWLSLISAVRQVYSGQLTYGANSNYSSYSTVEALWVPFWEELDFIGIDYYHPMSQGKVDSQAFSLLHQKKLEEILTPLKKWKKPIFINEVGAPIAENGFEKPFEWVWPMDHKENLAHQSLYLESFFLASKEQINNIQIWRYMPNEKKIFKQGYIINHLKTLEALRNGFH